MGKAATLNGVIGDVMIVNHEQNTFGIGRKLWDAASAGEKAMWQAAAAAENVESRAEFDANNAAALNVLVRQHRVQLRRFPDAVLKAIGQASGEVVKETAEGDPFTKKVYEGFLAFRRLSLGWTKISDEAFTNARLLPFTYG